MKKHSTLVVPIIFCLVSTSACKKDKPAVNTDEVRLTGLNMKVNGGSSTLHIIFVNDPAGKIRQINSKLDNAPSPDILYNILYNSNKPNEIIVAVTAVNSIDKDATDTIHLLLDGNNRVTKRIRQAFEEFKPPLSPQRTYWFDTTAYEYDGEGLLSKETRGFRDSVWFNPGPGLLQTTITRTTGESTYTNTNGDLKHVVSANTITTTIRSSSTIYTEIRTSIGNLSFEYIPLYPNKTDFYNAAVLNELNLFAGLPMNKNYQHLPSYSQFVYQERDQNGATISANNSYANYQFAYNYYGFVESKMDPGRPETKVEYLYSQ